MKSWRISWLWSSSAGSFAKHQIFAAKQPLTCEDVYTEIWTRRTIRKAVIMGPGGAERGPKVSVMQQVDHWLLHLPSFFYRIQDLCSHPEPRQDSVSCGGVAGAQLQRHHWAQCGHWIQLDTFWPGPGQYMSYLTYITRKLHHQLNKKFLHFSVRRQWTVPGRLMQRPTRRSCGTLWNCPTRW